MSQRENISFMLNDYVVYWHDLENDLSINDNDPISFSQAVNCDNYEKNY